MGRPILKTLDVHTARRGSVRAPFDDGHVRVLAVPHHGGPKVNHMIGVYSIRFFMGTKRTGSTDRVAVLPSADFCIR